MFKIRYLLFILVIFTNISGEENDEYYLRIREIRSAAYDYLDQTSKLGLSSSFRYNFGPWPWRFVEHFYNYTDYRNGFHHLFWWADDSFKERIERNEKEVQKFQQQLLKETDPISRTEKAEYIAHRQGVIQHLHANLVTVQKILHTGWDDIQNRFMILFQDFEYLQQHEIYFHRGFLFFDKGQFFEGIVQIEKLIESGKIQDILKEQEDNASKFQLKLAQAYSEISQYEKAIEILSELVKSDPNNKKAYFERAICYFEQGSFDEALEDYLSAKIRIHKFPAEDLLKLEFATGFIQEGSKACAACLENFVPSMLSSLHGLSHGLWTLVTKPEEVSKEFITACQNMAKFLKEHSALEIIQMIIPEVQELVQNWDMLSPSRKGELMGKIVGHHGTDFLLLAGIGKGVKVYQDVRKANAVLTLEKMAKEQQTLKQFHTAWWEKTRPIIEEIKQQGGRFDKELGKIFKNAHFTETQVRKILHTAGFKTFSKPKRIPSNCHVRISERGGGMTYIKAGTTEEQNILVRVMPGNPRSPNPYQQKPYVVQRIGDKAIAKNGELVHYTAVEAHVPLSEFIFKEW
ncbi:MAG: tetratricopeptide repeat protein [Chlamydiae bacterium]|nr:tetratricopeptide repeat protein [Chlamydiota bacterium]